MQQMNKISLLNVLFSLHMIVHLNKANTWSTVLVYEVL